jgi:CHASE2 domain-containing sensor protein
MAGSGDPARSGGACQTEGAGAVAGLTCRPLEHRLGRMTMRSAASLALLGAILLMILLVVGFVLDLLNVVRGLVPALKLVTSFIYAFAGVGAVVFLCVFRKAQS